MANSIDNRNQPDNLTAHPIPNRDDQTARREREAAARALADLTAGRVLIVARQDLDLEEARDFAALMAAPSAAFNLQAIAPVRPHAITGSERIDSVQPEAPEAPSR